MSEGPYDYAREIYDARTYRNASRHEERYGEDAPTRAELAAEESR